MATSDSGMAPTEGHIGNVTYYMRDGKLIMRKRSTHHSSPGRTPQVMASRTRMANLQNNWRAFNGGLKGCMETRKEGASDYNEFVSLNMLRPGVYLTREEVRSGAAVADNFIVSQGSLPRPVQVSEEEGYYVSDIELGEVPQGVDALMVVLVPQILRAGQGRLQEGDELLFVRLSQERDRVMGVPSTVGVVRRLPLVTQQPGTLREVMTQQWGNDGFEIRNGRFCAERREGSLVAWIIRRPRPKGRAQVTTQALVGHNPLLTEYTSQAQLQRAIESYGQDD